MARSSVCLFSCLLVVVVVVVVVVLVCDLCLRAFCVCVLVVGSLREEATKKARGERDEVERAKEREGVLGFLDRRLGQVGVCDRDWVVLCLFFFLLFFWVAFYVRSRRSSSLSAVARKPQRKGPTK